MHFFYFSRHDKNHRGEELSELVFQARSMTSRFCDLARAISAWDNATGNLPCNNLQHLPSQEAAVSYVIAMAGITSLGALSCNQATFAGAMAIFLGGFPSIMPQIQLNICGMPELIDVCRVMPFCMVSQPNLWEFEDKSEWSSGMKSF